MRRLLTLVASRELTLFNRAAKTIQAQLEANNVWELDAAEIAPQQQWKLQHDKFGRIFSDLILDQRGGGSYDAPIDLNKITTRGSA